MATVEELEAEILRLMKERSGVASHTEKYAAYTATIEKNIRKLAWKDKWGMFGLSQIAPVIAIAISVVALVRSCEA